MQFKSKWVKYNPPLSFIENIPSLLQVTYQAQLYTQVVSSTSSLSFLFYNVHVQIPPDE